jgi:hypothetical protein
VARKSPYRASLTTTTPTSLPELFGHARDLDGDDGLRLSYRVLPWKRIIVTVHYHPEPTLEAYIAKLAKKMRVEIAIEKSDELRHATYQVTGERELQLVTESTWPRRLSELDKVESARVRVDPAIRFALAYGECRFFVSSYDPAELAPRFERAYPWEKLLLPPLIGRTWFMQL